MLTIHAWATSQIPRHDEARVIADHTARSKKRSGGNRRTAGMVYPEQVANRNVTPSVLAQYRRKPRSDEHTSELQSLMRTSYAVFCLKKQNKHNTNTEHSHITQSTHYQPE